MIKFEVICDDKRIYPIEEIKLPTKQTVGSMAYDFYSPCDMWLSPNVPRVIMTDVKVKMDVGYGLLLNVRSSMGKIPIMMACCQGWIDSDYYGNPDNDGNIGVMLINLSNENVLINAGDRIAQGMIVKYYNSENGNDETVERVGGLGSTGV